MGVPSPEMDLFPDRETVRVRSLCVAGDIDTRSLRRSHCLATSPLTLEAGKQGCAVVFRYGAVVFFDVERTEEEAFLESLAPMLARPASAPQIEVIDLARSPDREGVAAGRILVPSFNLAVIQMVAEVMARSVVLERFEGKIGAIFEALQPVAAELGTGHLTRRHHKELLGRLGEVLLDQQEMLGRIAVSDKPDVLWDRSDLERLYARLTDEFEVPDRFETVEAKLQLIGRTAQTAIDLVQARRNLRVEWYIVILIVVEIVLTLYQMFFSRR